MIQRQKAYSQSGCSLFSCTFIAEWSSGRFMLCGPTQHHIISANSVSSDPYFMFHHLQVLKWLTLCTCF